MHLHWTPPLILTLLSTVNSGIESATEMVPSRMVALYLADALVIDYVFSLIFLSCLFLAYYVSVVALCFTIK